MNNKLILLISLLFLITISIQAKTNYIYDLTLSNVQSIVNTNLDGDVLILPAGSVGWSGTYLSITNCITLIGQGAGVTIITNLQADVDSYVIRYAPHTSNIVGRITGLTIDGNYNGSGILLVGYTNFPTIVRVDHCTFNLCSTRAIEAAGGLNYGVVDHCTFIDCRKSVDIYFGIGAGENYSWTLPSSIGTTNAFFVEDNVFLYTGLGSNSGVTSGGHGARYVWRHNVVSNTAPTIQLDCIDAHGNQAPVTNNYGVHRGTVDFQVYSNIMYSIAGYRHIHIRGGSGVIYSNVMSDESMEHGVMFTEEDGPERFLYVTNYPGYDPITNVYVWKNTFGGELDVPVMALASTNFVQENRDYFLYAKPNYVAPVYPHPLNRDLYDLTYIETLKINNVYFR